MKLVTEENLMIITIFLAFTGFILFVPVLLVGGKTWFYYAWVPATPMGIWWIVLKFIERHNVLEQKDVA